MSGETRSEISGWTVDTLHEHVAKEIDLLRRQRIAETDLVKEYFKQEIVSINGRSQEMDKRYEQVFVSAKESMTMRLVNLEQATHASFAALERLMASQLLSSERAILKTELSQEKRFDGVNEFREALSDQQRLLIPRAEAENRLQAMSERIDELQKQNERSQGRAMGSNAMWGYIIAGISVVVLLFNFFGTLSSKVDNNANYLQHRQQDTKP